MLIYAIDDEKIALSELAEAIKTAFPNAEVVEILRPREALLRLQTEGERPELVFSDIRMPQISVLELAVKIKESSPDTKIIFVTGYADYALDAFRAHANGYLLKPVTVGNIREEIEYLGLPYKPETSKLTVQCFGSFEVFYNGAPLEFKRRQTKELFAYLIDCNGASCTAEEVSAVLWEDEADLRKMKHRLRNLVSDLRSVLSSVGQVDVLIRGSGKLAVRRDAVDCDSYRMLDGDMAAVNAYRGEYMRQYIWAQLTEGNLHFKTNK